MKIEGQRVKLPGGDHALVVSVGLGTVVQYGCQYTRYRLLCVDAYGGIYDVAATDCAVVSGDGTPYR